MAPSQSTVAAMHHPRVTALIAGAALGVAGCGADAGQEVQAKLQQYAHAVADRRPAALCRDVLAPSFVALLQARTGLSCIQALTAYVDSVTDPTLSVSRVSVNGSHATAVVLAGAHGQRASLGAMHLVNGAHGWRVVSLTAPR
jgi:hypothetical protein